MRFSSPIRGLVAVVLASPTVANAPAVPRQLAKMDAEAFRSAATIDDDDLEFATIISTREGFRKERRLSQVQGRPNGRDDLRFRFAPPAADAGEGGVNALTIRLGHSVGAGQLLAADRNSARI